MYLYRAPLDEPTPRLVTASAHPIAASQADLSGHRVTLRWAPPEGGLIRTQRDLLCTSSPAPLVLVGYQQTGEEALLQFGPASRRPSGEGCLLQDRFAAPVEGPLSGRACLKNQVLTVSGRIGQTPFLRRLSAPGLRTGHWSVRGKVEGRHANLTLGPPDRPPLGARILVIRHQIQQPSARPLATGHVALEASLAVEAEWLDHEHRRRVTEWLLPLRHLQALPSVAEDEVLGVELTVADLRWAPDRPVWALIEAQVARYRPTFLPLGWTGQKADGWILAPILVGQHQASFIWTEPIINPPSLAQAETLEIAFPHPVSRLLALDLHPKALDLLLALKGGGLYLLTTSTPWPIPLPRLTAFAIEGGIRFQT